MMTLQAQEGFDIFCSQGEIEQRYWDSIKLLFHHVARCIVEDSADCLQVGNETELAAMFPVLIRLNVTRERWDIRLEITNVEE